MPVSLTKLTVEDLETFPSDGRRYEIIDGDLMMSPAPSIEHQRLLRRLLLLFEAGAATSGEVFFAPIDVRFSPLDQVQPDLIYVSKERSGILQGSVVSGAPDIVVEVLSPSTRRFDEVAKLRLFEANGVPEYWIVDPMLSSVRQLVLTGTRYVERFDAPFRSVVLPGLEIDPNPLFDASDE